MTHTIRVESYSVLLSRRGSNYMSPYGYLTWKARMVLKGDNWQVFVFFVDDSESAPDNFRSDSVQRLFVFCR